ncbi:GGDEF domain-containing protein [Cycloclasticus sp. P1]|uniref:GGDEF domain-containing protein n=1 Tax=Cycloclasticus sp. (strain P1) TaxID=385025 RepID=UPI000286AD90|nr:GGDEF domain-containing protein [Cycloclasticus sp. P1]AFT68112.1 Diguanylate cyclase [Cycloclasticus sp. P1]
MFDSLSGGWGQQALDVADFGVLVMNEQGVQWLNPYLLSLLQQEEIQDSTTFKSSELTSLLLSAGNPFPVPPQQTQQRWLRREHIKTPEYDIYFFHDCTDLVIIGNECRRLQDDLSGLNLKDPTTGMMSNDVIVEMLDGHISRSRRYDNPLSLLRISYFFSDQMDSQLFSRCVKRIAYFLKDQLRWADQIGMLDPHTFLVILPETNYQSAASLLKKFNEEPHLSLFAKGDGRPVSFSVGLTEWSKGDTTQAMLQALRDDIDLTAVM